MFEVNPLSLNYIQDELAEIIANHEYELSVVPQTSYISQWTNCFKGSFFDGSSNLSKNFPWYHAPMHATITGISLGTIKNPFLISLVTSLVNMLKLLSHFGLSSVSVVVPLLLIGASCMITFQFIVGIVGVTAGEESRHNAPAVSAMIAFICLNIAAFATTWGPAAWVVVGEIFPFLYVPVESVYPPHPIGSGTASLVSLLPTSSEPKKGDANLGAKVFFMWGSLCALSRRMLEETNPRTSAKWVPHSTFAAEMGLAGDEKVEHVNVEKGNASDGGCSYRGS
ncbi:hypothetical protein DID88_003437 [Monilinia fructigena]|uniref:Major facilitator superfamily (MFS) profile domain-containing protein n=1 Tax=Monilinia fructigena TaxID=38457 RepID=A0A395IWK6_9HELO|nr:hypothetical protein DID88_003437 [Monilinia fructigena]